MNIIYTCIKTRHQIHQGWIGAIMSVWILNQCFTNLNYENEALNIRYQSLLNSVSIFLKFNSQSSLNSISIFFKFLSVQVHQYMSVLPRNNVPLTSSIGAKYRIRQLILQLPPQDNDARYCRTLLTEAEQKELWIFSCRRTREALGRGSVWEHQSTNVTKCKRVQVLNVNLGLAQCVEYRLFDILS